MRILDAETYKIICSKKFKLVAKDVGCLVIKKKYLNRFRKCLRGYKAEMENFFQANDRPLKKQKKEPLHPESRFITHFFPDGWSSDDPNEMLKRDYPMLAIIHDKVLPDDIKINNDILSDEEAENLWGHIAFHWHDKLNEIRIAFERVKNDLEKSGSHANGDTKATGDAHKNRVEWNDKDKNYYSNKEAIDDAKKIGRNHAISELTDLDYDKLKRLLRQPDCPIRYMSLTRPPRGRIHKNDWHNYLNGKVKENRKFEDAVERETKKRF
jgi:hypothetical protein